MTLIPNVLEKTESGERVYDLYSRLLKDRIIFLTGEINDTVSSLICAQLLFLEAEDSEADIYLHINSPGGSVTAAMAIYDTMNYVKPDVQTICVGLAASAGSLLLTAGAKGKRVVLPHSKVMIHQPLGGARGQATDIEIQAQEILKVKKQLHKIYSEKTGQSIKTIADMMERDKYFDSNEAVKLGLVDKIVTERK